MNVDFRIRVRDLAKATKHLLFNRAQFADTDFADILVSETGATFRAVGTDTEVPVNGTQPGTARYPNSSINRTSRRARRFSNWRVERSASEAYISSNRSCARMN